MSERSKYTLNGIYKCEDFADYVENRYSPSFSIGLAGSRLWNIRIITKFEDDSIMAFPIIYNKRHTHPRARVRFYFKILKKDGSAAFEMEVKHKYLNRFGECVGKDMDVKELLSEENETLDNGELNVEYGLQVDSVEGYDGIWRFNFCDKFFEWQTKDNTIEFIFRSYRTEFCHKQIIKLHSTTIDAEKNSVKVPSVFSYNAFYHCMQITHGVRLQLSAMDYQDVVRVAFHFGLSNTVRYCERQLIKMEPIWKIEHFEVAVKCNMKCYLVHLLKQIETKKHLINLLRRLDLDKMSSESMKAIVAKIFSL